jgi:hypothetical protein
MTVLNHVLILGADRQLSFEAPVRVVYPANTAEYLYKIACTCACVLLNFLAWGYRYSF